MKDASWEERKFYTIDLEIQEPEDVADKFIEFLSKDNISSDEAIKKAEATHKDQQKSKVIEKTLPEAWNKIISEPEETLVNLLSDTTESLCGHSVRDDLAIKFLRTNKNNLTIPVEHGRKIVIRGKVFRDKGKKDPEAPPPPDGRWMDKVLKFIADKGGKGASWDDLRNMKEINDNTLRTMVHRLKKRGKIRNLSRGVFVKV